MSDHPRRAAVAGCLMLLAASVSAQQADKPTVQPVSAAAAAPVAEPVTSPVTGPVPAPVTAAPPPILTSTIPATVLITTPPRITPNTLLGNDLHNKVRYNEARLRAQDAEANRAFDAREAAARNEFEGGLAGKGFWERRRLTREFNGQQAKRRAAFNAEQDQKRLNPLP
ncbi:MAG: hypothetical protein ACHQ51_06805 [Elusimicrobiota bacterium]